MLLLTSASDLIQIVTDAAATVDVHASWLDNVSGTITPGRTNTAISTAATTTVVGSPASGQRNVQTLIIRNKSALSDNITVRHSDGSTIVELMKIVLYAGQELTYLDGQGWQVFDARGNILTSSQSYTYPVFYDAQKDFGFVGDLVTVFDGACSTGANTKITSATGSFTTTAVVGQRITLAGAGASGAVYVGTINAIDSASQVNVSPVISTTVSAKGCSWGTDNTAAIAAMTTAVNNAVFWGARIFFGRSATNSYGFPAQALFNKPIQMEGIGGGHTADSGDYTRLGGTRLAWWGTSLDGSTPFAPFISVVPAGAMSLKRVAFRHCWIDARNGDQNPALIPLKLASCHGYILEDFFIMDPCAIGLWTNIGSTPSEAKDTTRFSINDFCIRALDNLQAGAMTTPITMTSAVTLTTTPQSLTVATNTLPTAGYAWVATNMGYPVLLYYTGGGGTTTLTGCVVSAEDAVNAPATINGSNVVQVTPANACCMLFDGGTTANTCCGMVRMVQLSHGTLWGPAAVEMRNSDSVDFLSMYINGGNNTNDGAINRIRKPGVRLNGSNTSATLAARNNTFRGGSAGVGGVSVMGLLNTGSRMLAMSGPHYWDLYQLGNGEALPTVEGNTNFIWSPNGGLVDGTRGAVSIADQSISAATLTLITGSLMAIPPQGFQAGTKFKWKLRCSKTGAGVAARNFFVKIGTTGGTGDGTVATFLSGTPTGVADTADMEFEFIVRVSGASSSGVAHQCMKHNLAATGFSTLPGEVVAATMNTWNSTTAQQFIGLYLTTGASEAITVQECSVECVNAANP